MRTLSHTPATALLALLLAPAFTAAAEPTVDALDCVISPHEVVDVSSAVPGLIETVVVEHSDAVAAGQEVARLESGVEQASLQLAEAWASIESEVELERTNGALDHRRHERIERLFKNQAVALDDRDRAKTEVALSELRVRQAQEKRWIRRLDAVKARAALERRIVRSPIDGVVVERYRSPGEYVENQPILRIAKLDPLKVETILPMSRFGEVEPGMVAEVSAESAPGRGLRAVVHLVDRMGDAASGTFSVRLTLPNPGGSIPAGIKCDLRFVPGERAPVPGTAAREPEAPAATTPPPATAPGKPGATDDARPASLDAPADSVSPRAGTDAGAVAAAPAACAVIGPLAHADAAEALVARLTARGASATLESTGPARSTGFFVMTPPHSSYAAALELVEKARSAGLHDLQVMPASEHGHRVSLGYFSAASAAQRRNAEVLARGIEAEVVERAPRDEGWWVRVGGMAPEALRANGVTEVATLSPDVCAASAGQVADLVAGASAAY